MAVEPLAALNNRTPPKRGSLPFLRKIKFPAPGIRDWQHYPDVMRDLLLKNTKESLEEPTEGTPESALLKLSQVAEQAKLQSDEELLSLYVDGGNRQALEMLIERYAPMVASVCRLTVADVGKAEDAFQATFLVLMQSARKIRKKASLASWLHGVAYRTAARIRKRSAVQPRSNESPDDVNALSDARPDPVATVAKQMQLEALDRELENLPEQLRAPLVEHYLLGFSAPEVAQRMDLSVSAVEGRLKRGRQKLRTLLARRGISLSVVLAGTVLFQQHVQAAEASQWSSDWIDVHLKEPNPSSTSPSPVVEPQVSALVQGELLMSRVSSPIFQTALAGTILLAVGVLGLVAAENLPNGGGEDLFGNTPGSPTEDFDLVAANGDTVLAQGLPFPVQVTPNAEEPQQPKRKRRKNRKGKEQTDAPESTTGMEFNTTAQMGGIAGGGLGGGGGFGAGVAPSESAEPVPWAMPGEGTATPSWLAGGSATMEAIESNREELAVEISTDAESATIEEFASLLSEQLNTNIYVNPSSLEMLGLSPDQPIDNLRATTSVREHLRRALEPLELSYHITESGIEILSRDEAQEKSNLRFYDLAYILPNSSTVSEVISAIESSIAPDTWEMNGGISTISMVGSIMVVSATDQVHQQIEILLLNISKMNPQNAMPTHGGNGGGFGGGGFGGGGGGGMF